MVSRERAKFYPISRNLRIFFATLKALPSIWRDYCLYRHTAYRQPVEMSGRVGVAVDVYAADFAGRLEMLAGLGTLPVMIRFYHHCGLAAADRAIAAVKTLIEKGHPVSMALVQDRNAVRFPETWEPFVDRVLGALAEWVELVEVGHAINRVKWGVWDFSEYRRLMMPFLKWKKRCPGLCLGGPAMIDFEYPYVPAALDALPAGMQFDAMTHHLYVDRRGAPETPQGRFAMLEKCALGRALAVRAGDRLVVSELNWPPSGTGVYSPVGAPYVSPGPRYNDPSVSEQEAAAYLLRYVLIAICSGLVERVFWWRLVAFGYGLVDDSRCPWRKRPGFAVLAQLLKRFSESTFIERATVASIDGADEGILYRFTTRAGDSWSIAYCTNHACQIRLPLGVKQVSDSVGNAINLDGDRVTLGMMPIYLDGV